MPLVPMQNCAGENGWPIEKLAEGGVAERLGDRWGRPAPLSHEALVALQASPGVYEVQDMDSGEVVYIGETRNLRQRLRAHLGRDWQCRPGFVYSVQAPTILPHQLKELENDLIGALYGRPETVARFQFGQDSLAYSE